MLDSSLHLAISRQLANLASHKLKAAKLSLLEAIINQVFIDLAAGNSCSHCSKLAEQFGIKPAEVISLLLNSELAVSYLEIPSQLQAKPLSILKTAVDSLVYLSKYLAYELVVARTITGFSRSYPSLAGNLSYQQALALLERRASERNLPNPEQLAAILNAVKQQFTIISGGPGTGKTTTIVLLLWLLYQIYGSGLKVKVCAPTGKAALRVRDSIQDNILRIQSNPEDGIDCQLLIDELVSGSGNFGTIHKLLGFVQNSIYFKHNQENKLDVEVLIVDESSMVSLPLFSKLLQAIDGHKLRHLILLGDKNQLSSVEEGYVFASLINAAKLARPLEYDLFSQLETPVYVNELMTSNRNQGEISDLARLILKQDLSWLKRITTQSAPELLAGVAAANDLGHISLAPIELLAANLSAILRQIFKASNSHLIEYITFTQEQLKAGIASHQAIFKKFNSQSLLCLTNSGMLGSANLNLQIERKIRQHFGIIEKWYSGRPLIILQNDYSLELFNGDIGICLIREGRTTIVFENGREFIPEILPAHQLAYAITIHKSQGSEYDHVNVILPAAGEQNPGLQSLLSRELVYTAITRARTSVCIFSSSETLAAAVSRVTLRNSGLVHLLNSDFLVLNSNPNHKNYSIS